MAIETGYMSRIQAVIQNGQAQIDLAVLIDKEHTYDFESGNRLQNLLNLGYSYNLISESILSHPNATVSSGRLAANGPAYKALIADHLNIISLEGAEKLASYAKDGLPIIVYGSSASRVYGSQTADDAAVASVFETLKELPNVRFADTLEDIETALAELGVASYAQYSIPQLETTVYKDSADGTLYYYMFNNGYPENTGMMGNTQGQFYKGEDKAIKDATIVLAGEGVSDKLDNWNGEITPVYDYDNNEDGTVTAKLDELYGGDSVIYAVTTDTVNFPDYGTPEKPAERTLLQAIDLTGEAWNLVIHSYGPDADSNDPSVSLITDVDFGLQTLGKWKDIPVTEDQLATLAYGVRRNGSGGTAYPYQAAYNYLLYMFEWRSRAMNHPY
jgi:hypothetical protein